LSSRVAALAGIWAAVVLGLLAIHVFLPQRSGVIALTQVFEPFIVMTGLVAAAIALISRRPWSVVLVAVFLVATVARYAPGMLSMPAQAAPDQIAVATWNIIAGNDDDQRALAGLRSVDVDLVGLQELQPPAAEVLTTSPEFAARYPYRVLDPDWSVYGVGLLSRHPIAEHQEWSDPPLIRALVVPEGRAPIAVFVAHAMPARIADLGPVPIALDTARRDASIAFVRSQIELELARGRQVVVLGDFNVTDREPAYADLADGLRDAHLDAGLGPGLTWRPAELASLPFGVLRIDYAFSSPDLVASATHVECTDNSDHCLLTATLGSR
jgi:vancomycin resistance protein VanJ